jgi:hypothetical protein
VYCGSGKENVPVSSRNSHPVEPFSLIHSSKYIDFYGSIIFITNKTNKPNENE